MVLQRILMSTTRSLMLNNGRQWRDPDSNLHVARDYMNSDCCGIADNRHLKVTFLIGESGRGRRVCAREGETIAEIAHRNGITLEGTTRVEAFLHPDVRPPLVDDHFYTNLRGPGQMCVHENLLDVVPELCEPAAIRWRALSKDRHDGLHIALL